MNFIKSTIVFIIYILFCTAPLFLLSMFLRSHGCDVWGRFVSIMFAGCTTQIVLNWAGITKQNIAATIGWTDKEEENK